MEEGEENGEDGEIDILGGGERKNSIGEPEKELEEEERRGRKKAPVNKKKEEEEEGYEGES